MSIWNVLRRMITGGKRNSTAREEVPEHIPQEYKEVLAFNRTFDALMTEERFIARSDYKELVEGAAHLYQFYETLSSSNVLDDFIRKSKLDSSQIDRFRETYAGLYDLTKESPFVQQHNEEYVKRHLVLEKDYLDTILKECDPAILLDEEQRRVLLSEEDHTLVIAGAGAGKTTTVAAKVKYLVDKRGVEPSKILVISFTNKAVGELRERINGCLHINCPITTFHSAGYAILRKGDSEGKRIVDGGYMYAVINKYLKSAVMSREDVALSVTLAALVLALYIFFYQKIFAITFDETFARATGVRAGLYNTLIAVLTAVTIVLGMRMMGALLISSLIIFPALTAMRACRTFRSVTVHAAVISVVCLTAGLIMSYLGGTPAGASVVMANIAALILYSLAGLARGRRKR